MPAGAEDPLDPDPEGLCGAVQEMQDVTVVGAMGSALSNRAAGWAHDLTQGVLTHASFK